MIGFVDTQRPNGPNVTEPFRPAVIEVLGGLFEGELARVNRFLDGAASLTVSDDDAVVTAFVRLTPTLVLEVRDDDATIHLELRRLTDDELRSTVREEHAGEQVIGADPVGIAVDDDGTVLPPPRRRG